MWLQPIMVVSIVTDGEIGMSKGKITMSVRLNDDLHTKLQKYTDETSKSITSVLNEALEAFLESQKVVENYDTGHPDFGIQAIRTRCSSYYDKAVLYSTYAGCSHVTVENFHESLLTQILQKLESMIEFIDNTVIPA